MLLEALLESASNDVHVKIDSVTEASVASVECLLALYVVQACAPLVLFCFFLQFVAILHTGCFPWP